MSVGFDTPDFERAVALVSAEPSPRLLVERLGLDWDYLGWLALDASATVLGEQQEERGAVVAFGGEAFTAGFLIGAHVREPTGDPRPGTQAALSRAVEEVRERGRHAVIADHCDLASVARLETVYAEALVDSMGGAGVDRNALEKPVTRIFEAGLAVGLELGAEERAADKA